MTKFLSVLFKTQVKALKYYGYLCAFINSVLGSLLQNNEALKGISVDSNMITVAFLQDAEF